MAYYDGTFTTASQNGPRRPSYPFGNTEIPDTVPVMYDREMMVLPESFSPQMATRTSVTNLAQYSEELTNAWWGAVSITPTINTVANPQNGAVTGGTLTEVAASAAHYVNSTGMTITANNSLVARGFFKAGTSTLVQLVVNDGGSNGFYANFDLSNGTVCLATTALGTGTATSSSIVSVGSGWYLCAAVGKVAAASTSATVSIVAINATNAANAPTYLGSTANYFYNYGMQFQQGTTTTTSAYIATTNASRTGSSPNLEYNEASQGSDLFAFLVMESDPTIDFMMGRFQRRYARVPGDQIVPGNQWFNRPVMHDIKSGTSYAATFPDDKDTKSYVWSSRISVSSLSAPDVPTTANPANGATPGALPAVVISITANNSTQTFNANDSDSTIQNAISTAVTGSSASAANFKILRNIGSLSVTVITTNTTVSALSSAGASVIVSCPFGMAAATGAGPGEIVRLETADINANSVRTIATGSAHSGAAGGLFAAWNGDKLVAVSKAVSASGSTMTVPLVDFQGDDLAITHIAFATQGTCYLNGPKLCTVKKTQKFYLPGVTSGITTYADIPDVTIYTDPVSWLGRIIAVPTGYAAIAVNDLAQWQGPILMQETAEVQMSDAIETVTP